MLRGETAEDAKSALSIIGGQGFFMWGVWILVMGLLWSAIRHHLFVYMLLNGATLMTAGIGIQRRQSRMAALILFMLSLANMFGALNQVRVSPIGWIWVTVHMLVTSYAAIAIRVSFRFHKLMRSQLNKRNIVIKSMLALLYAFLSVLACGLIEAGIEFVGIFSFTREYRLGGLIALFVLMLTVTLSYFGQLPFTKNRPLVEHLGSSKA